MTFQPWRFHPLQITIQQTVCKQILPSVGAAVLASEGVASVWEKTKSFALASDLRPLCFARVMAGLSVRIALVFLILGAFVARYFQNGPFLPLFCSLFGISCPPIQIHGYTAPGYEKTREIYKSQLEKGYDVGGRFTAYRKYYTKGLY